MTSTYQWIQFGGIGVALLLYVAAWLFRRDKQIALQFVIAGALVLAASSMIQFLPRNANTNMQADRERLGRSYCHNEGKVRGTSERDSRRKIPRRLLKSRRAEKSVG